MLPLPPIRTGHDSSKSSSFKPCASRARAEDLARRRCDQRHTAQEKQERQESHPEHADFTATPRAGNGCVKSGCEREAILQTVSAKCCPAAIHLEFWYAKFFEEEILLCRHCNGAYGYRRRSPGFRSAAMVFGMEPASALYSRGHTCRLRCALHPFALRTSVGRPSYCCPLQGEPDRKRGISGSYRTRQEHDPQSWCAARRRRTGKLRPGCPADTG